MALQREEEQRESSAKPMADCPDLDFQLVVEATIRHRQTSLADASVDRSEVVAGLLKIREDLRTRGAPPPVLKSFDVFIESLRPAPQPPSNSLTR
jgi:hypothetical protein